jgi:hypothetical protein
MTIFGKILVFMNLLFAVATGALIIFVFTTRTSWQAAYEDAKKKAEAAETAYKAEKASHDNDIKQKDSASASDKAEIERLTKEMGNIQAENERLAKAATDQTNLTNKAATSEKALQTELAQLKTEREDMVKEQGDLRGRIVNQQKEIDSWRNTAVNADLQAKNLLQKNNRLLQSVEELTLKVRDLESIGTGTAGTGGSGGSIVEPPPRSAPGGVRGKVTSVSSSGSGLAQIDIGSDSGLSPGNVLTVYQGSEYKGDLQLQTVLPKSAVGKFVPAKRTSKIEAGDKVITSFSTTPQ